MEILGKRLDLPVLAAPIGGMDFNMGGRISEADFVESVLAGAVESGTLGGCGDGVPDVLYTTGLAAIKALGGAGIPFFKPWGERELLFKLERVLDSGATIVGMDIDAAGLITLREMGRPVSPKSPEQLRKIIEATPMAFLLKGIMTPDDALLARDVGAAGIVVSNHGGRVFEHTPGTAEVVPKIAKAVKGQIAILADGGIRSGGDVLKMLALGADAVMIGRPVAVAAIGGSRAGVVRYLEQIRSELVQAMILTGCRNAAAAETSIIFNG